MSDFTTIRLQCNTGSGAAGEGSGAATWTSIAFGGTSGANEVRFCASGAGGASTASASWPFFTRPGSTGTVPEAWACTADTTCAKISTYDATTSHYLQFRWDWDNVGTFSAAPSYTLYGSTAHTNPTAGDNSVAGGNSTDTNSTGYLKSAAYGFGVTSGGSQQTPGSNAGGTLTVTTGTAGAVNTSSAAWSSWQSLQGSIQYMQNGVSPSPAATTAGDWYFLLALYSGPNANTGSFTPVLTFTYSYV